MSKIKINKDEQMKMVIKDWQTRPDNFLKHLWPQTILWDKLIEIINSVKKNKRTVVPSGHGVGKTFISAKIALWFLFTHYPAKVITTAPTWPQVEKLLWSEIAKSFNSSEFSLGGRLLQTELKLSDDWFALGLSTQEGVASREYGATKFQGFHSKNLLVILDEAPGVKPEIWKSIETLITGVNNKILAIGNPTSPSGDFFNACRSPLWNKIKISCYDHPNVKENKEIIPGAVTREWIKERKQEWGENSGLFKAKILGEFPDEGDDTMFPLAWVENAMIINQEEEGKKSFGFDVARFGDDKTVFAKMYGAVIKPLAAYQKRDTMFTVGIVVAQHREEKFDYIAGDDSGLGGGVTDRLKEQNIIINPLNFGASAIDKKRFANLKAEIYWNLRDRIKPDSDDPIQLPKDDKLKYELTSIKFKYTSKGQIQVESKDDLRKRLGHSPDRVDAVVICNAASNQHKEVNIRFL